MTQSDQAAASIRIQSPLGERLRGLATLFLKLGAISFGGPAAHIALMENEVVRKRQWVTRQQFLDMLGLTNLIPGPNSTELAINVGFARARWLGLAVAGASFILPAALITVAVAWAYVRFGALPLAESLLAGVKPAVIAVIAIAVWRLGKIAVKDAWLAPLGLLAFAAFLVKLSPMLILAGGGLIGMLVQRVRELPRRTSSDSTKLSAGLILLRKSFLLPTLLPAVLVAAADIPLKRVPLARLGWFFLKVGAVLYGGGYVLFAFVEQGLVRDHHWLTQQQVLDAIAIGQFTPGPVLSTATFIGYLLGGVWGAAVATVAVFLPSFFYMAALGPVLPKLRRSVWMTAFLDSVNVCAVALMAGVTVGLSADALRGWPMWVIAGSALAVLSKWKINPAWVVLGGGLTGVVVPMLGRFVFHSPNLRSCDKDNSMRRAVTHLKKSDPVMRAIIERFGPCRMQFAPPEFHSLAEAIVYQQLNGKAAETIFKRFAALAGEPLTPEGILKLSEEQMREAGLSKQKTTYLKDLAAKTSSGLVDFARLPDLPDAEVVEHLTQVKGIGLWTAQMFLMFTLKRGNVLPTGDFGVRMAMYKHYLDRQRAKAAKKSGTAKKNRKRKIKLPSPEQMEKIAKRWEPYRSVACWYLWKSLDTKTL